MNAVARLCSRALLIDQARLRMDSKDVGSVIHTYLSDAEDGLRSRRGEWRNAGNEFNNSWFQPQRFFMADAKGAPLRMPARSDVEIWVHLVADFKALDPALVIGYDIQAEGGDLLYRSCQTDGKPEEWPQIRLGRTVLRGRIPSHLLNEGVYRLNLIAALHNREWILHPNGANPFVFLELQGGVSDSPLRNSRRAGFLAPVLRWESCENDDAQEEM
jgi:lipopolysaccharide transport system ATP-binding protein